MFKHIWCALICVAMSMPPVILVSADSSYAAAKKVSKVSHRSLRIKSAHRATKKAVRSRPKHETRITTPGVAAGELNTKVWPDPMRTPGWTNPDVTQSNIKSTVCKSGWTKTIRPPTRYTNGLKTSQIEEYDFQDKKLGSYEEDHLISLQLGGHPTDARNLWPQAYAGKCGARVKDVVETKLKTLVCKGEITLAEAQQEIAQNWVGAYIKYVQEIRCPGS